MKPLPLPVRVAAGLAVTAVDRARHLPERLAELPVTMVSQALQLSMRLQQHVTELAIKGDDALATLRPVEESPEWATFDEDEAAADYDVSPSRNGVRSRFDATDLDTDLEDDQQDLPEVAGRDPWAAEERAMRDELGDSAVVDAQPGNADEATEVAVEDDDEPPAVLPFYPELSLPQLRARLRRLTADELSDLLSYERSHEDRPEFVGMLTRRIATLRDEQ